MIVPEQFVVPLLLYTTVAAAVAAAFAFRNRPEPGAIEFAATMGSFSVWSGSMSLYRSGVLADRSHLLLYLVAVSILGSGIAWLCFGINYTGRSHWMTRRRRLLVFGYGVAYTVLVFTNSQHQLVYRLPEDTSRIAVEHFGPLFFVSGVLSWIFTVVGTGLLVHLAINSRNVYRKMNTVNGMGGTTLTIAAQLDILGMTPTPRLVVAPIVMGVWASVTFSALKGGACRWTPVLTTRQW